MRASGASPESRSRAVGPVTRTDLVRYAGASGDFNPVHHDDAYARGLGFPSVFAMGMWTAGVLGAFVSDEVGPADLVELAFRFKAPVWPGERLTLAMTPTDGSTLAELVVSTDERIKVTGHALSRGAHPEAIATPAPLMRVKDERCAHMLDVSFPDVAMRVEFGKVIEFARAVGAQGEVHFDVDAAKACGYPDLVAPPTFTATLAHWSGGDASDVPLAIGLDLTRVVHGEQRYVFTRPLRAGDELTVRRRVVDARTKTSRSGADLTVVTFETVYLDLDEKALVTEEMVLIEQAPQTP